MSPPAPAKPAADAGHDHLPHLPGRPELRITLLYLLFAALWIVVSDRLLEHVAWLHERQLLLQTCKGLSFVVTTGILLYFLLRRAFGGWRRAEHQRLAVARAAHRRFQCLSSRIQLLREEERTRIAREIHDQLGQQLTAIKLHLRLLEDRLPEDESRRLNPLLDGLVEASAMIDDTIGAVRHISSGLRPPALDHLGLPAALAGEAEQFTRRTGIECLLSVGDGDHDLPQAAATAAFRIFQESLTNVARHAQARRVDAACGVADGSLTLTIRDDGVGFDPAAADHPASLGLIGMRERAADAGGSLEFHSRPGGGTLVTLRIPLEATRPTTSPTPRENPDRR